MACILLIVDGMTDGDFDAARFPTLSRLGQAGASGTLLTTPDGFSPGTLPCVLTLLGVPAADIPREGRGRLEAKGAGLAVAPGELALRVTWADVSGGLLRRVADAPSAVREVPGVRYVPLGGYKALLLVAGWGTRSAGVTAHPPHDHWGEPTDRLLPSGCPPLEEFCRLNRDAQRAPMPWGPSGDTPLGVRHAGAAAVAANALVRGMAAELGFALVGAAGATGDTDTDLAAKCAAALAAAGRHPLVLLHLAGADEASHRLDAAGKRDFLARVDRELLSRLAQSGHRLLVTSDHGASPVTGKHLGGPQPFVLCNTRRRGALGLLPGTAAVPLLKED